MVKIIKYWLPLERAPMLDSIAIDKDNIWFYTGGFQRGIGQIRLKDSKVEFNHYALSWQDEENWRDLLGDLRQGKPRFPKSYRRITGQGIAARDGYVWYCETEGVYRIKQENSESWTGIPVRKKQALCKIHSKTHRVRRYLFPSPDEVSLNQFAYRLELDSSSRRVWGATFWLNAWVFDAATNKLKVITIGKVMEQRLEEHVARIPEHVLRDVAVEPNGKRGWFIDQNEALYILNLKDESLLKYPLTDFRPIMIDLAPDGKIWCTSQSPARTRKLLSREIKGEALGYILSLDPKTNELTTYLFPNGFRRPGGILVTDEGEVWFGFSNDSDVDWGISKLNPEEAKGSTTVITPEEPEDWGLTEYDVTEVEGEKIPPDTFDLYPDQPIIRESHKVGFFIYRLDYRATQVRGLMQDSRGRIWFTTWGKDYIGFLTS